MKSPVPVKSKRRRPKSRLEQKRGEQLDFGDQKKKHALKPSDSERKQPEKKPQGEINAPPEPTEAELAQAEIYKQIEYARNLAKKRGDNPSVYDASNMQAAASVEGDYLDDWKPSLAPYYQNVINVKNYLEHLRGTSKTDALASKKKIHSIGKAISSRNSMANMAQNSV